MTVCIAGKCVYEDESGEYPAIVIAADRLFTWERPDSNAEHDAPTHKVFEFGPTIVALHAGDMNLCLALCQSAAESLRNRTLFRVRDVALAVALATKELRAERFENLTLQDHNVTLEQFQKRPREIDPELLKDLKKQYSFFDIDAAQIVAGVDDTGSHLYSVDGQGLWRYLDAESVHAIGQGEEWARDTLSQVRYHHDWRLPRALFAVYAAKRHAEAAQSVGKITTSIVAITRTGIWYSYEDIDDVLTAQHQRYRTSCDTALDVAAHEVKAAAGELTEANRLWVMQQIRAGVRTVGQEPPAASSDGL